jgi:lactate permease
MSLAALVGGAFSVLLYIANIALGPALAGVAAGLATLTIAWVVLRVTHGSVTAPPKSTWPYAALFLTALVQRALIDAVPAMREISLVVGDTSWAPLTSPGVALLVVAILAARPIRLATDLRSMAARAVKPVAAVGLFLLMAVTMTEGGMVATLTAGLGDLPVSAALAIVAGAGFLSGYITGSNVGGNALLMPTAAGLGSELGEPYLFAAVQNSAAGHAVLASLPIVLLLASLAQADDREQNGILRFGLVVGALNRLLKKAGLDAVSRT